MLAAPGNSIPYMPAFFWLDATKLFKHTINQEPLRLLHTLPHLCHLFTGPVWRTKRHAIPDFSKNINQVS